MMQNSSSLTSVNWASRAGSKSPLSEPSASGTAVQWHRMITESSMFAQAHNDPRCISLIPKSKDMARSAMPLLNR
jgi:hypothetical protein